MCSLGYEAIDCYGKCDIYASNAGTQRKQLLDALLYATSAPSKEVYLSRMQAAADLSSRWNYRVYEINDATQACKFDSAVGFVLKLRLPFDTMDALLSFTTSYNIFYTVLFRNPVQRVVSEMRMYAGAGQFAQSKQIAAAPIKVEYNELRDQVAEYLDYLRQTHELLYRLDVSFLSIAYSDFSKHPRQVLVYTLSFMGLAPPGALEVKSRFRQSAPPSLHAKVSNLDGICNDARAEPAADLYKWLQSQCP